jgi:hypothetical protein
VKADHGRSKTRKNWAYATIMYEGDFSEKSPLFGEDSTDYTKPFWFELLAPYVAKQNKAGNGQFNTDALFLTPSDVVPEGAWGRLLFHLGRAQRTRIVTSAITLALMGIL